MKKFTTKCLKSSLLNKHEDEDIFAYIDNEENSVFSANELSKKLKQSNYIPNKNLKEYSFNANYTSNSKKNNQNDNIPISSQNSDKKPLTTNKQIKLKRLSDMENNNLYFLLKLEEHCDKEIIKKSYKNLCRIHHPDKGGDPDYFNKVTQAYRILNHDICRKLYDNFSCRAMLLIEYILNQEEINQEPVDIDIDIFNNDSTDLEAVRVLIQMQNES